MSTVSGAGLRITVLPAARAASTPPAGMAKREVPRRGHDHDRPAAGDRRPSSSRRQRLAWRSSAAMSIASDTSGSASATVLPASTGHRRRWRRPAGSASASAARSSSSAGRASAAAPQPSTAPRADGDGPVDHRPVGERVAVEGTAGCDGSMPMPMPCRGRPSSAAAGRMSSPSIDERHAGAERGPRRGPGQVPVEPRRGSAGSAQSVSGSLTNGSSRPRCGRSRLAVLRRDGARCRRSWRAATAATKRSRSLVEGGAARLRSNWWRRKFSGLVFSSRRRTR